MNDTKLREQWLNWMVKELKPWFSACGNFQIPEALRVTCGWPSRGGLGTKKRTIGECWSAETSGDQHFEIFISPALEDALEVGATLVHEIVHTIAGTQAKHKGPFKRIALALGLEGKMTSTNANEELLGELQRIAQVLGSYPHAKLTPTCAKRKEGTRLLLFVSVCAECSGYKIRTTKKWLEAYGAPLCPHGILFEEENKE